MGGFNHLSKGITNNRASKQNFEVNIKTGRCISRKEMPIARFGFGIC